MFSAILLSATCVIGGLVLFVMPFLGERSFGQTRLGRWISRLAGDPARRFGKPTDNASPSVYSPASDRIQKLEAASDQLRYEIDRLKYELNVDADRDGGDEVHR